MIERVTLTGIDNSVDPETLDRLHEEFPFVEFGILFSRSNQGKKPRFPAEAKIGNWFKHTNPEIKFAAHLCGESVKDMIEGGFVFSTNNTFFNLIGFIGRHFPRFQLNMCPKTLFSLDLRKLASTTMLGIFLHNDFILQSHYGFTRAAEVCQINHDLKDYYDSHGAEKQSSYHILCDASGGRGVPISDFPRPYPGVFCGYAGGINPDNIGDIIDRIKETSSNSLVWIDMETGIRENDVFCVSKARDCLSVAKEKLSG
jgi:hypothetical protein